MRNEAIAGIAIILIALGQHLAVLDQQETGDALMREEIVERKILLVEAVFDPGLAGGLWQRQRRPMLERVVGEDLFDVAEGADPDTLVIKPGRAVADGIARRLAQHFLIRRGNGGRRQRKHDTSKGQRAPHSSPPKQAPAMEGRLWAQRLHSG